MTTTGTRDDEPERAQPQKQYSLARGAERGDELPQHLRTREGRRKALREAKERLERERNETVEAPADDDLPASVELDPREIVTARTRCAAAHAKPARRAWATGDWTTQAWAGGRTAGGPSRR